MKIGLGLILVALLIVASLLLGPEVLIMLLIASSAGYGTYWLLSKKFREPGRTGLYFNVIWWNVAVRLLVGFLAGTIGSSLLFLLDKISGTNVMDDLIFSIVFLVLFAYFFQADETTEEVPETYGAMLTFLGMRFKVYRKEGKYTWTGKRLGFGRSKTVHDTGTNKDGFIKLEQFPFSVWNNADKKVQDKKLETLAGDTSTVKTTLTLTLRLVNPFLWVNSGDPALDLAEQARTAFRTAVSFFTGVDCAAIKSVFVQLMQGNAIVAGFLINHEKSGGNPKGSLARNKAGKPLYEVIDIVKIRKEAKENGDDEETIMAKIKKAEEDKKLALEQALDMGEVDMNNVRIETRTVELAFTDVLDRLGVELVKAAVGDVDLSPEVSKEANKAASEVFQHQRQVASANAYVDSTKIMAEGISEHKISDLDKGIAAAQDNPNVKIVVTSSGESLKDAAAVHATLSGGKS